MTRHDTSRRTRAVLLAALTLMGAVAGVAALGGTAVAHDEEQDPHDHLRVDDSYNNTTGNYYKTISAALDDVGKHDTITVRAGTYDGFTVDDQIPDGVAIKAAGNGPVVITDSVTVNKDGITIRGADEGEMVVTSDGTTLAIEASNVTVDGVTLRTSASSGKLVTLGGDDYTITDSVLNASSGAVAAYGKADDGRLVDNKIIAAGPSKYAVRIGDADGTLVADNEFVQESVPDSSSNTPQSLLLSSPTNTVVEHNDFQGAESGQAVLVTTNAGPSSNVTIIENDVSGYGNGVFLLENNGPITDATITENTITGTHAEGIALTTTNYTVSANDVTTAGSAPDIRVYGTVSDEVAVANDLLAANSGVDSVAFNANGHTYGDVSVNGTYYHDIQAALDAAADGDTVSLAAGTYTPSSDLDVTTANVTLAGAGQGDTVIDASALSHYGIDVKATGSTFEGFTLVGPQNVSDGDKWDNFGMHIGNGQEYVSTTVRDVTVTGSALTELDLIGIEGAVIENVTLDGQDTSGAGLGLSDAKNVSVDGITTSNNTWGGIAVMTNGQYGLPAETTNVTITGVSSTGEPSPVYVDPMYDGRENITGVSLPGMEYRVTADDYRDGDFAWYFQSQAGAEELAEQLATDGDELPGENPGAKSPVIEELGTGNFYVVEGASIQDALDAVSDGSTVTVLSGTYDENVTVDTANVTLAGSDATLNGAVTVNADGATVTGLEIHGAATSGQNQRFGVYVTKGVGDVTVSGNDLTTTTSDQSRAILLGTGGSGDVTIADNHVEGWTTGAYVPVSGVTIENNTFANNTAAIGGIEEGTVTVRENEFDGNSEAIGVGDGTLDLQQDGLAKAHDVGGYTAYYETIQQAVDNAVSDSTVTVLPGTYTSAVDVDKPGLTVVSTEGADKTTIDFAGGEPAVEILASNVTFGGFEITNVSGDAESGQGLTVSNNAGKTLQGVVVRNLNIHHVGDKGLVVDFSEGTLVENVRAHHNFGDEGITVWKSDGTTIQNATVYANGPRTDNPSELDPGIFVNGNRTTLINVTAYNNSDYGVAVNNKDAWEYQSLPGVSLTILDSTFQDNPSAGVGVFENERSVMIRKSTFKGPGGVVNENSKTVDARLNYWGSDDGPTEGDVEGSVVYDPFLTAPPGEVAENRSELQQFGHDLTVPGDGEMYAVGFPAPLEDDTVAGVFGEFDGTIWAFDEDAQQWTRADPDDRIGELDAVVVVAEEETRAVVEFAADTGPAQPGSHDVRAGWNFVAAPQSGGAEVAFGASSADPERVIDTFADPGSQPMGIAGEEFSSHTFVGASGPQVSPYTGYWVYANEDGTIAVNGYDGMTLEEVSELLAAQDEDGSE